MYAIQRAFPLVLAAVSALILIGTISGPAEGQTPSLKKVMVYFYHDPGEYIDLSPVERHVGAASPARGAIEELLKGPTSEEKRKGFGALESAAEFDIGSLKIANGIARVNFVASRTWAGWAGDLAPARFRKAVELTLRQFPNVRRIIVSLNGDEKFDDER